MLLLLTAIIEVLINTIYHTYHSLYLEIKGTIERFKLHNMNYHFNFSMFGPDCCHKQQLIAKFSLCYRLLCKGIATRLVWTLFFKSICLCIYFIYYYVLYLLSLECYCCNAMDTTGRVQKPRIRFLFIFGHLRLMSWLHCYIVYPNF